LVEKGQGVERGELPGMKASRHKNREGNIKPIACRQQPTSPNTASSGTGEQKYLWPTLLEKEKLATITEPTARGVDNSLGPDEAWVSPQQQERKLRNDFTGRREITRKNVPAANRKWVHRRASESKHSPF